jgi:hypothetical protein
MDQYGYSPKVAAYGLRPPAGVLYNSRPSSISQSNRGLRQGSTLIQSAKQIIQSEDD